MRSILVGACLLFIGHVQANERESEPYRRREDRPVRDSVRMEDLREDLDRIRDESIGDSRPESDRIRFIPRRVAERLRDRAESIRRGEYSREEPRGRYRSRDHESQESREQLRHPDDEFGDRFRYDPREDRDDWANRRRSSSPRSRSRYNRNEDSSYRPIRNARPRPRLCLCSDSDGGSRKGRLYSSARVTTPEDYDLFYADPFDRYRMRTSNHRYAGMDGARLYEDMDYDAGSIYNPTIGVPYSLYRNEPHPYRRSVFRKRSKSRRAGRGFGFPRVTTPENYDPFYLDDSYEDYDGDVYDDRPFVYNPPAGVPYSLYRSEPTSYRKRVFSNNFRSKKNSGRTGRGFGLPRVTTPENYDPFYLDDSYVDYDGDVYDDRPFVYNPPAGVPYSLYREEPKPYRRSVFSGRRRNYNRSIRNLLVDRYNSKIIRL